MCVCVCACVIWLLALFSLSCAQWRPSKPPDLLSFFTMLSFVFLFFFFYGLLCCCPTPFHHCHRYRRLATPARRARPSLFSLFLPPPSSSRSHHHVRTLATAPCRLPSFHRRITFRVCPCARVRGVGIWCAACAFLFSFFFSFSVTLLPFPSTPTVSWVLCSPPHKACAHALSLCAVQERKQERGEGGKEL